MKTILVVGNTIDKLDAMATRTVNGIKNQLPKFSFLPWDPTEEFPKGLTGDIVLIDTVRGIHQITVFRSLADFSLSPRNTVHDFDLPTALGLLQKLGIVKHIVIIGIPASGSVVMLSEALREVLINNFSRI